MPIAIRGARTISFQVLGEGPAVVLVPGLGAGSRLFGTLPRRFERAGLRCVTFDPVGIAPSSPHRGNWSFEDAAGDVLAVLDAAEIESVVLVGTSLGGKLGLATAALAPSRVRGLAMLASSAVVTPRARSIYRFFELVATNLEGPQIAEVIAPFLFGATFHRERSELVADIMRTTNPDAAQREFMAAQARALPGFSGEAYARALRCPCLVVGGAEDTLTAPDEVRATAALLRDARLVMIENAGHSLLLESPQTFAETAAFVRSVTIQ